MTSSAEKAAACGTTCRMVKLMKKLSIDEQRTLARLLNDWEQRDQRLHPRIPCSIATEYHAFNHVHKGRIKNISLGGAYIDSARKFPLNLKIEQSFFSQILKFQSNLKVKSSGPVHPGLASNLRDAGNATTKRQSN